MNHPHRSISRYFVPAFLLLAPLGLHAGAISVNSTCYVGDCSNVDSIGNGQSTDGTFAFMYTFGDGDQYYISGTYGASYSTIGGSTISIDPTVTYTGSGPSLGTDTVDFDFFQDYYDPSCCTWAGTYTESVPLNAAGAFGAGSQMSGELFYDGVGVGLVGPDPAPGSYFVTQSNNLDFGADDTIATLSADYNFHYTFGEGTEPGATEYASNAPEPLSFVLCWSGIVLGGIVLIRRGRSRVSPNQEAI